MIPKYDGNPIRQEFSAAHIRQTQIDAAGKKFADDMEISEQHRASERPEGQYGRVSWFVVGVRAGREQAVFDDMSDSGIDVLLPKRTKEIVGNPKRRTNKTRFIDVPAFSGYLFVRLWQSSQAWHGICGFDNVVCILGSQQGPLPVADKYISKIKGIDWRATVPRVEQYLVGDAVHVTDGLFKHLDGEVSGEVDKTGMIKLLVSMFGRETPARLPLAFIKKVI